jgi:phosphomannomutase / phosphoglucomutase
LPMGATINPEIFREYDIRGVVGVDLDKERMALLGKAFGAFLSFRGEKRIVVGRDNRKESPEYMTALVKGLLSTGIDVVDIGEITTPGVLFATKFLKISAGISVTASHNPKEYNGVKLVMGGRDLGGKTIQEIKHLVEAGRFPVGKGKCVKKNLLNQYVRAVVGKTKLKRKPKVAVDCGNGVVGKFILAVLKKLRCKVVAVNCKSDPSYPNHQPDTVKPEFYPQLIAAVRKNRCDVGLMFDGDGDRVAAVDETGKIVWADMLLLLYARDLLKSKPGAKVVVEIKCSQAVLDDIKNHGGVPILWKTGRTNIEEKMFGTGAVLGGEMSGHMFFIGKETWLSECLYAAAKLLEIMDAEGKPLSALLTGIPEYHSSQEFRAPYTGKEESGKFRLMERILSDFKGEWGRKVLDIDGARVIFPSGWGLVRVSKGEPLFSMRFEGKTEEDLKEIMGIFRERMKRYPEISAQF